MTEDLRYSVENRLLYFELTRIRFTRIEAEISSTAIGVLGNTPSSSQHG
jgi:hypothetical protein